MVTDRFAQFAGRLEDGLVGHLGMRVEEAGASRAVVSMDYRPEVTMPFGYMHGGALAALADTAAGIAVAASLGEGERFVTAEMKLNLLRGVKEGTVRAIAEPLHRGRRTGVYQVRLVDGVGNLVGIFICTQMILEA